MLELINQFPWLIYLIIGGALIAIILAVIVIFQGREVSTPLIKYGERKEQPPVYPQSLGPEQMDELSIRVAEKVQEIQREASDRPPGNLYQPPELPERIRYIYSAQYDIEGRVRSLVLSHGGTWMGCSWASFDTYLDNARTVNVLPEALYNQINDFQFFTQANINLGQVTEMEFLEIQYLAANIIMQLDEIPIGPLGPEG